MVQWWNAPGILAAVRTLSRPALAVPHISVTNISEIDFAALKQAGIKGLVFDKDNCLTAPYVDTIHPPLEVAWHTCKQEFGDNIVIYSNSAGSPDDKDYSAAKRIEAALGVRVVHHNSKKPEGGEYVLTYFPGVQASNIAMFGDRVLTDIVFGNTNGMLTILTGTITLQNDNAMAKQIRKVEYALLPRIRALGVQAPDHPALAKYLALVSKQQATDV